MASFAAVRKVGDALLATTRCKFYDLNDAGFEASLREQGAPRRAYGIGELLRDLEGKFGLAKGLLARHAEEPFLYWYDLLAAIAAEPKAKVPAFRPAAGAAERHRLASIEQHDAFLEKPGPFNLEALDRAHVEIATALSLEPDDPSLLLQLGNVLRSRGRTDEAAAAYLRIIPLTEEPAAVYYNLGLLYEENDREAEAAEAYQQFCAIGAAYPDAVRDAKARLAALGKPVKAKPSKAKAKPRANPKAKTKPKTKPKKRR